MEAYFSDVAEIRRAIELYVLKLYEPDGVTLKAYTAWPGYYQTPNNTRIPAVWITGERIVPTDWKIFGIECVITGTPTAKNEPRSGSIYSVESWPVRFTNYGTSEGTIYSQNLSQIRGSLIRMFPTDQPNHAAKTDATYENLTLTLSVPVLVPPLP